MVKSENLYFEYAPYGDSSDLPRPILRDINISIESGEFVAILGHNGSGKSTLAKHLNALLVPKEGTLWIKGMDTKLPDNTWKIRQTAGMVFQNPDNQIIATIVEEDVAFGPENMGVPPDEIRRRVGETLEAVGMSEYAKSAPHHLSGGQKQRVAIAGVLAMRPGCIVLDEPTAMLDPSGRREVLGAVSKLNRESGITIILITHFMEEAVKAGRVLVMSEGEVVMDDTPRNIFRQVERLKQLGLAVPQVTALAHSLRKGGVKFPEDVLTVDEFIDALGDVSAESVASHDIKNEATSLSGKTDKDQPPIIKLEEVTHIYNPGSVFEKKAVDNVSLEIAAGEMTALIGHTGSGKSTLIQHLNALMTPTSGKVYINGKDIHADKSQLKSLRQRVGLVFQYPEQQLFEVTVYKDVAFGPERMGLSPEEVDKNTKDALEAVGLGEEFYNKSPFELSGGEKRRVAIAGVLAMHPEVLILDEPAAGLDPKGREDILSQIKHMHQTLGLTVILVSHNMDDAARLSNRILVMNKGQLVCDGTPAEVFAQGEMLKSIGLDTPQISRLMVRLNQKDSRIPVGIFSIEAAAKVISGLKGVCL